MHEHSELLIYSEVVELWSSATCHHNRNPEKPRIRRRCTEWSQLTGIEKTRKKCVRLLQVVVINADIALIYLFIIDQYQDGHAHLIDYFIYSHFWFFGFISPRHRAGI